LSAFGGKNVPNGFFNCTDFPLAIPVFEESPIELFFRGG
jgi:hypothetical protein